MERNEVTISLSNEEVKEAFEIFAKSKDYLETWERNDLTVIEIVKRVLDDLSKNQITINEENHIYLFNQISFTQFPVLLHHRAVIVHGISKKIIEAYRKLKGEAHE